MEMRRFIIAAVPSLGFVFGSWALSALNLSDTTSLIGAIVCIALAIGVVTVGVKRIKVKTKRKTVSFPLVVNGKTYQVEFFVLIKGHEETRQHLTTPDYWSSVIRIGAHQAESTETVKSAVLDCIKSAVRVYNVSTSQGTANKLEVYGLSISPEGA